MGDRNNFKKTLELSAAKRYLLAVGHTTTDIEGHLRCGDPKKKEPDIIFDDPKNGLVGLEVTWVTYDNRIAEKEATLRSGERHFSKTGAEEWWAGWNPDGQIVQRAQERLEEKCAKVYSGVDETRLILDVQQSTLVNEEELGMFDKLDLPKPNPFSTIVVQVYPTAGHDGKTIHTIF